MAFFTRRYRYVLVSCTDCCCSSLLTDLSPCASGPAFSNPYIISVSPPSSHPSAAQTHSAALVSSAIQVRLSSSLNVQQVIKLPTQVSSSSPAAATNAAQSGATARLLSTVLPSSSQKRSAPTGLASGGPVNAVYLSTPNDKLQLSTDGNTIWALRQETWRDQLDEMIKLGRFDDGLGLVKSLRRISSALDKDDLVSQSALEAHVLFSRRSAIQDEYERRLKTLSALSLFSTQSWTAAFNEFMALDITPAKIVALFPADQISGRLHIPQSEWVEAFGGPVGGRLVPAALEGEEGDLLSREKQERMEKVGVLGHMTHLGLKRKPSMDTLADKASIREGSINTDVAGEDSGSSEGSIKEFAGKRGQANRLGIALTSLILHLPTVYPPAAVENLMIYLSDRRQKLAGAIAALDQSLPPIDALPPLKTVTTTELIHYPSVPMADLSPEELVRVSQIVYTALIKVYLMIRPSLVGSLCRIENWCEVGEVEELLKERSVREKMFDPDDVLIVRSLV